MQTCTFCESIPNLKAAEVLTLVTQQIRKCPGCNTYFEFNYEYGEALGYTDESIERIEPEYLEEVLKEHIIDKELLMHHFAERDDEWAKYSVEEAAKDKANLEKEIQANR